MVLHNKIEACNTCNAVSKAGACRSFDRQHHTYPIQKKSRWSVARQHMTKSYFYESSYFMLPENKYPIHSMVKARTRSAGGLRRSQSESRSTAAPGPTNNARKISDGPVQVWVKIFVGPGPAA